ncbi:ATP-binding protein [Pseudomonas sp. LjRoot263]|uniref:ATP-binding protein n=1 Tax=Pseudomonas sp. LjRoot263 TaxID=3342302 RepID=UPI003ECED498
MATDAPRFNLAVNNPRDSASAYVKSIFNREMGVTLHNAQVGSPRDDAMRELTKTTTNLYARRVLRELIQNAFDGAAATGDARILVRLDLREGDHGTLYVANSGTGFTEANIDAISNPALSNKRPGNFIGHKGLGFRSVELLSDEPQIFSVSGLGHKGGEGFDGFCFRFASNTDQTKWLEEANAEEHAGIVVGRTHRLQLPLPITEAPPEVTAFALEGFATLVRLPLRNALAAERAHSELKLLIDEKAPIALFLHQLSALTLETIGREGAPEIKVLKREVRNKRTSQFSHGLAIEEVTVDRRRFLVTSMSVDEARFRDSIEQAVEQRQPVEKWLEWVGAPVVSAAFPISADAKTGTFYAFLPMESEAPFNGCLDAPFFPEADRRSLDLSNPLNSFLLDSIADLCLLLAEELADANETSIEFASVATDAVAWCRDPDRLIKACNRLGIKPGSLRLPIVRRKLETNRWGQLRQVFDWDDSKRKIINAAWLVRACDVTILRRGLGEVRVRSLHEFAEEADFDLQPLGSRWIKWAPALAEDLNGRKHISREKWEQFYSDLADMPGVLAKLGGAKIFRLAEGELGSANRPGTVAERELFISPEHEPRGRRRRLAGTFPPASVAKQMDFADPALYWSPVVAKAMFAAGLATEYSLAKVIGSMGRLLGSRPSRTVLTAALRWTFSAWLTHNSTEVENALKTAKLQVPVAGGTFKIANSVRFGAGWRDTKGELIAEFCDATADLSRDTQLMGEALLMPWDAWPLREQGSAAEWLAFLRLIGVRDGLGTQLYKERDYDVSTWRGFKAGVSIPFVDKLLGPQWQQALVKAKTKLRSFNYQSGSYATKDTLFALPMQAEHSQFSDRAKIAYARLVVASIADFNERFLSTILHRTTGYSDQVRWPSPLLAFLCEAEWIPVVEGDEIKWVAPRECWYSPRSEPMPRLVPRLDRSVRELLEGSSAARNFFIGKLSLQLWTDPVSALGRLKLLGALLENGITDNEHDGVRTAIRDAWRDWHQLDPRPPLPEALPLVVQMPGRLTTLRLAKGFEHPTVFIGEGEDPALENLLVSLGHHLLTVPSGTGEAAKAALSAAIGGIFISTAAAQPTILIDELPLDYSKESERLTEFGREWLAEIAVLALEFNRGFSNRASPRTRQQLYGAFKRLRIVIGRQVQVEIETKIGDLPAELDGVLPMPHAEHPTLVVQNSSLRLDWPMLARISRGIAAAVERPWLDTDMRMAFLALASLQPVGTGVLERPSDDMIARAFGQPVERVREIVRSLRNTSRRLFDLLIPFVQMLLGPDGVQDLLNREHQLTDDGDITVALATHGLPSTETRILLERCREAENLDELRREFDIPLKELNVALAALGPPWEPISFEKLLRRSFAARVDERRVELEQKVRDAHLTSFDTGIPLTAYVLERELGWVTFKDAWIDSHDELDNKTIDERIESLFSERCTPAPGSKILAALEITRQHNRAMIVSATDHLRKVMLAWVAKDTVIRVLPQAWRGKAEHIARAAMTAGALDFRRLEEGSLPAALALADLWPATMPRTLELGALGLNLRDLEHQGRAEQEVYNSELKRRRTVTIGSLDIDGGAEGAFQAIADALETALSDTAFQVRSGPANLREFPANEPPPRPKRSGKTGVKDPEYMSDERRTLIGFAGELAAYRYLSRKIRNFSDEYWISSMGRRFLALPATSDDDGFDFRVPRTRGALHFEVKAHEGDPGLVELERSQVAAAVAYANGKNGTWSILYVAFATDPARITVYELPNPFSPDGLNRFRPSTKQGVRLLIERE